MATFKYEALYEGGEKVSGIVEAKSSREAVARIRQNCDVVLSLKEVPKVMSRPANLEEKRRIKAKSLALTCQQFAIILRAGLPLVQTVDLVAGQTDDKALAALLRKVSEDVSAGWSISYSLDQRGDTLPVTFRETIRAGEESGDLVSAFERMGHYYDRVSKTNAKAISTMIYPAFVMVVAVIVVAIIMIFAVPAFTNTFASLDLELPGVTKGLIAVSNFMRKYILLILLAIGAVGTSIWLYARSEKGGLNVSRWQLTIPIIGEILRMAGASQFAHTMSAMLAAGMPILQSIEVSARVMTSRVMAREVEDTMTGVEGGHSLGSCMAAAKELPPMLVQMTAVGESAGALETTLSVLADYYDNEVSVRTDRALALIEPIIICVMAVVVILILLSVYMPLFSLYEGI